MAEREQQLVDALIATYRELNGKIRHLPENRLRQKGSDGESIRDILVRMRDDELKFSQALKERIAGASIPDLFADVESGVVGTEHSDDPAAIVLSQFGTARESTLAMLRSLDAQGWSATPNGGRSISDSVRQLTELDRRQLERINSLIGTT